MQTIAICDDDAEQLARIRAMTETFLKQRAQALAENGAPNAEDVAIRAFTDAHAVLGYLEQNPAPAIALLDICMPALSGIQLARAIRKKNAEARTDTSIIFLTTSREYTLAAFDVNACHYLVKPVTQAKFDEAMRRAADVLTTAPKRLLVHGEGGSSTLVDIADIQCIESIGYRRYVRTARESLTEMRRTLSAFAEELEKSCPGQFIQPYRGYIVNLAAIRTITSKCIELKNGASILIKSGDFRTIKKQWFDYIFERGGV